MHKVHLSDVTPVTSGQLELSPWKGGMATALCKSAEEEALYSYSKFYFL